MFTVLAMFTTAFSSAGPEPPRQYCALSPCIILFSAADEQAELPKSRPFSAFSAPSPICPDQSRSFFDKVPRLSLTNLSGEL